MENSNLKDQRSGSGWNSTLTVNELPEEPWEKGYFASTHDNWDGKTWIKNFAELRTRDLSLFAMGDINGKTVLDVGCGRGMYMKTFFKLGASVAGQDIVADYANDAKAMFKKIGAPADIQIGSAEKLHFDGMTFDVVFSGDVFEHISYNQKKASLSEIYRVLKPGGIVTLKTPNLSYLKMANRVRRLSALLKLRNPFNIHIPHTHDNPDREHHGLSTHAELTKLLEEVFFHTPTYYPVPLNRKGLPNFVTKFLYGNWKYTDTIIISARKSIFLSVYE